MLRPSRLAALVAFSLLGLVPDSLPAQQSWGEITLGTASFGDWRWAGPVANVAALPAGAATGTCRWAIAEEELWCWTGSVWVLVTGGGGGGAADFSELTGQLGDDQTADGAIDGGTGGEIADGSITAADLGADAVGASELDASAVESELEAVLDLPDLQGSLTLAGDVDGAHGSNDLDEAAVETELEAVLDLADLQGAVTDAQVPNDLTVDLATLATTATTANAGDSATAFFPAGTLEDGRLSANVSLLGQTISASEVAADVATQAELDALDTSDDDLSDNQLDDLLDVDETGAGAGEALVSDGAGAWSASAAQVCLEDGTNCPAGGSIGGSTGSVDEALLRANGTGGSTVQAGAAVFLTDAGVLQFGGTSSSFPALSGSGAILQVVQADASTWTTLRTGRMQAMNSPTNPSVDVDAANGRIAVRSAGEYRFSSTTAATGSHDAALSRAAAGVVKIDDALRLDPISAPPVTCGSANTDGVLYFDDDSNEVCACAGGVWVGMIAGGACS